MAKKVKTRNVGIDVSAKTLCVAMEDVKGEVVDLEFENTAQGHRRLCKALKGRSGAVRVGIEATGTYGLDVALALVDAGITVFVLNPLPVKRFAEATSQRGKTDRIDARVIRQFIINVPVEPWSPPDAQLLQLRGLARRIADLVKAQTAEKNRLAACRATGTTPAPVLDDIELAIQQLEVRIEGLLADAIARMRSHAGLAAALELVLSVPGIAERSAVQLLPELLLLPPDMTAKQWVAYIGLDPRPNDSGQRKGRRQISKRGNAGLRRALFMPALVAARVSPHVHAHYEALLARGTSKIPALVAVMRKLVHALWGMLRSKQAWDGERYHAISAAAA